MAAPIIHYGADLNLAVVTRGHPYERDSFMSLFDALEGVQASLVEQPAASRLLNPQALAGYDAVVLYDMPGLDFRAPGGPAYVAPDEETKAGFRGLLEAGIGIVALHHAIAGWPAWPDYGDWLGGRFLYRPGEVRGRACLDSGYRHDVAYTASTIGDHPVLAGVAASFPLTDELYLGEVFEGDVTPLLRSSHDFVAGNFYSASHAVAGRMFSNEGWDHPSGSNLIGWTKTALNSRLVYLQPGDGPVAYADPNLRRLVENAIRWTARRI